jgi:antitoxin (DNA-binding transcriptional repressor) of toxin-antitoxin stability system
MNMNEFRSTQPLREEDFAAIRRNVMTAIAARKRFFPIAIRFAFAAAVVIAIGVAFLARRPAPIVIESVKQPLVVAKPPVAIVTVAPPPIARIVAHHPRHRQATHSRAQYASATPQNIRVEFRTSDPDVRIIWIASQTPSTTTGGKS